MIVEDPPALLSAPDAEPPLSRRAQIASGITWTAVGQVVDTVVSFAAMLVLVRIIAPADYGRAAAAVGVIALLNTFGSHMFLSHAIQLPDGETPDWQAHWSAAVYIHSILAVVCFAVGTACWHVPQFRPIAPLLQIASVGFLLDAPNQLGAVMLRRQLDFRMLRLLSSVSIAVKLAVTVIVALAGGGAYAIVLGGNVATSAPYAAHLLLVRRWRPPDGWLRLPRLASYTAPLRFGAQQIATGLVSACSSACEAAILPGAIGFEAIGLLTRARALYSSTGGRVSAIVVDAVYPFLPRSASARDAYARHATLFLQVMMLIAIPAATFLGLEGPQVSRVLYGRKWIRMDPLIWPGAMSGLAIAVSVTVATILVAAGRLRSSLMLEVATTVVSLAALGVAWAGAGVLAYGWALAAAELLTAGVSLRIVSPLLGPEWPRRALYPSVVSAAGAAAAVLVAKNAMRPLSPAMEVFATGAIYTVAAVVLCRILFEPAFVPLVRLIAGPRRLPTWLAGEQKACA